MGSDAGEAKSAIRRSIQRPKVSVNLSEIVREGQRVKLHVDVGRLPAGRHTAVVYVALADDEDNSLVSRGENAGHALTHVAVVRTLAVAGEMAGAGVFSQDVSLPFPAAPGKTPEKRIRVVGFVQEKNFGEVFGVARKLLN